MWALARAPPSRSPAPHAVGVSALAARSVRGALVVSGDDAATTITFRRSSARSKHALDGCAPVRGLAHGRRAGRARRRPRRPGGRRPHLDGWLRATATTSTTLELLSTVDVVLGDVRGCCSTEDGALVYGDDGAATVVLC